MHFRALRTNLLLPGLMSLVLMITIVGDCRAAPRLSRSDFYRYKTWVRAHASMPDDPATAAPFPGLAGVARVDTLAMSEDRLMTAALSLQVIEDYLVREWKRAAAFTPEQNLSTARSYRDVGEYGESLRWYRKAARSRRSSTVMTPELRQEMFAVAVMTGDSLQVTRELLNLVGMKNLNEDETTVELAVRWLVTTGDDSNLDHLMRKMEGQMAGLGPRLWFWHAYVQAARGDRSACLASLKRILARSDAAAGLERTQRGWIMRTYADLHYLAGLRADALRLYNLLAEVDGQDGDWARYQLANHHLIAGEYDQAEAIYTTFCGNDAATPWQARACEMATLVAQLTEIRKEGETYGTDVVHGR